MSDGAWGPMSWVRIKGISPWLPNTQNYFPDYLGFVKKRQLKSQRSIVGKIQDSNVTLATPANLSIVLDAMDVNVMGKDKRNEGLVT